MADKSLLYLWVRAVQDPCAGSRGTTLALNAVTPLEYAFS